MSEENIKFKCLRCHHIWIESDLLIETYGINYNLERYYCPECDGTCIELDDF